MTLARYTRTLVGCSSTRNPRYWPTVAQTLKPLLGNVEHATKYYIMKTFKNYLRGLQMEVLYKESKIMKNKRED